MQITLHPTLSRSRLLAVWDFIQLLLGAQWYHCPHCTLAKLLSSASAPGYDIISLVQICSWLLEISTNFLLGGWGQSYFVPTIPPGYFAKSFFNPLITRSAIGAPFAPICISRPPELLFCWFKVCVSCIMVLLIYTASSNENNYVVFFCTAICKSLLLVPIVPRIPAIFANMLFAERTP